MKGFYDPMSVIRIGLKTISSPIDYLVRGRDDWYRGWRNDLGKYGGYLFIKRWLRRYHRDNIVEKLEKMRSFQDQAKDQKRTPLYRSALSYY